MKRMILPVMAGVLLGATMASAQDKQGAGSEKSGDQKAGQKQSGDAPSGKPAYGYPPHGYPAHGYPAYGYPPHGYPPNGYPHHGHNPAYLPQPGYQPNNPAGNSWLHAAGGGAAAGGARPGQGGPQMGGSPGVLGPWYLYYPYEAHFITPAHPHFPFWPSPQTLYKGQTDAVPPVYAIPSYWK